MYVNIFGNHSRALQKDSRYSQHVDEETEVQGIKELAVRPTTGKWQDQDSHPGLSNPEPS